MTDYSTERNGLKGLGTLKSVLLFWLGYVAITIATGFATRALIPSEVWAHIAWAAISIVGVYGLSRYMLSNEKGRRTSLNLKISFAGLQRMSLGYLIGFVAFGVHILVITTFAGPIEFERAAGIGVAAAAIFFIKYLTASCMEELGFRGYTLQRLKGRLGMWPAVIITSIAFGLSHLNYGWDIQTILLGVIPMGLLWAMAAIATGGIAIPIGMHAAWNFAAWVSGSKSDAGLFRIIVADDVTAWTQAVGNASYLGICAIQIAIFWFIYRKNNRRGSRTSG